MVQLSLRLQLVPSEVKENLQCSGYVGKWNIDIYFTTFWKKSWPLDGILLFWKNLNYYIGHEDPKWEVIRHSSGVIVLGSNKSTNFPLFSKETEASSLVKPKMNCVSFSTFSSLSSASFSLLANQEVWTRGDLRSLPGPISTEWRMY